MKILYFDTETTGLDPVKNDIIQLGMIIEVDGEVKAERLWHCQPFSYDNIEPSALETHGITVEEMKKFNSPGMLYADMINVMSIYINKFNRDDKFYPAGYSVRFDLDFLASFFRKCGDSYFGSRQNWRAIDPLGILYWKDLRGELQLKNYKLETVAEHYGIELKAHNALEDVKATRQIINLLMEEMDHGKEESEAKQGWSQTEGRQQQREGGSVVGGIHL